MQFWTLVAFTFPHAVNKGLLRNAMNCVYVHKAVQQHQVTITIPDHSI